MPSIIINLNGITADNLKDKSYIENFVTGIATGVSVFFEPVS
jgi:hypothetical protein